MLNDSPQPDFQVIEADGADDDALLDVLADLCIAVAVRELAEVEGGERIVES